VLSQAQATPRGEARPALAAALDVPGWYSPSSPDRRDKLAARGQNQHLWNSNPNFFFLFAARWARSPRR
jgi:hypothetical protein